MFDPELSTLSRRVNLLVPAEANHFYAEVGRRYMAGRIPCTCGDTGFWRGFFFALVCVASFALAWIV